MKRLLYCSVVMALMALSGARHLEGQGMGAFMDWIGHLSGPDLRGPGVLTTLHTGPLIVRLSVGYAGSGDDDDAIRDEDGESGNKGIHMVTLKAAVERVLIDRALEFAIGLGGAAHRFAGDFDKPFRHFSFRLPYPLITYPGNAGANVVLAGGVQYFFEFDTIDFKPLEVKVKTHSGEWTPWVSLMFEWRR